MGEPAADAAVMEAAASEVGAAVTHAEVELDQNEAIEATAEVSVAAGEAAIEAQETAEVGVALGAVAVEAVAETQEAVAEQGEAIEQVAEATEATATVTIDGLQALQQQIDDLRARLEPPPEPEPEPEPENQVQEIPVNEGTTSHEQSEQPRRHRFGRR